MLKNIQRRKSSTCQSSTGSSSGEVGRRDALEVEIERLRKDRSLMMREVIELQGQQLGTVQHMNRVGEKIQAAEKKQRQMVSFLANVFQNPALLGRLEGMKHRKQITSPRTMKKFMKHNKPSLPDIDTPSFDQEFNHEFVQFLGQEDTASENLAFDAAFGELELGTCSEQKVTSPEHRLSSKGKNVVEDQIFREKNAISPQKECPYSFLEENVEIDPQHNVLDHIMKDEDLWPTDLDTGCFGSGNPDMLWGNTDMQQIGYEVPNIWGLDSLMGTESCDIDRWVQSPSKDLHD